MDIFQSLISYGLFIPADAIEILKLNNLLNLKYWWRQTNKQTCKRGCEKIKYKLLDTNKKHTHDVITFRREELTMEKNNKINKSDIQK